MKQTKESVMECYMTFDAVTTIVPDKTKKAVYDEAYGRYQKLLDAVQELY